AFARPCTTEAPTTSTVALSTSSEATRSRSPALKALQKASSTAGIGERGTSTIVPDAMRPSPVRQASKQERPFMPSRLRRLVREHPVVAFYELAFPLSWRAYLAALFFRPTGELGLDPFGPLVAAVVVTALAGGLEVLRTWGRSLLRWRAAPALYAFALLVP